MPLQDPEHQSELQEINSGEKHLMNHLHCGPFLGLIYTFLSCVLLTLSSVIVKKMTYVSTGQLSLVQNAGVFAWTIPIAVYTGQNLLGPKPIRLLLIIRSFSLATALYLNILAFRLLPLAEAAIIFSTTPAVATIAARLYLKESCGLVSICALVLTVVGVVLSARIPELIWHRDGVRFSSDYIVGMASATAGVFCFAYAYISVRKMKDIHFSVMLLTAGIVGIVENASLTAIFSFFALPRCGWDSILMMSVGLFGFAGHCFLLLAIQSEAVASVATVKAAMEIVLALVFQVVFFSDYPDAYNSCGAFIVVIAAGAIGMSKWLQHLPDGSRLKKRFKFMLL